MLPPLSDLAAALGSIGSLPGWVLWGAGLGGLFWGLYLWSRTPQPRAAGRCGGWAGVLFSAGLLLHLGESLVSPPAMFQAWQWGVGLLVLPWLTGLRRVGAIAAVGTLLCLAAVMAGSIRWLVPIPPGIGGLMLAGGTMLVLAIVLDRLLRANLPPPEGIPMINEQSLRQRLDSAEANEAADKYTRE